LKNKQLILQLSNITKDYPGTRALDRVSFDLHSGEIHCLVGENGAGKSTLIKILSGAENPDAGVISLFGINYSQLSTSQAIKLRIATIYQDVDLVDSLTVADNIFLGSEICNQTMVVNRKEQEKKTAAIMNRLKIKIDPTLMVGDLSPADKQILQIVKAIFRDAEILVMDEPTSSLGFEETNALMDLIRSLASQGKGIIYISHYLKEVTEIGDRITVLKDGRVVNTYEKTQVSTNQLVRDMVGRNADLFFFKEKTVIQDEALIVKNYTQEPLVKDVSFSVRVGEIFGIGGMVGSGRSELVALLYGAAKKDSGKLIFRNKVITPFSPSQAIRNRICLITEDRKVTGLFLNRPVIENIKVVDNEMHEFILNLKKENLSVLNIVKSIAIHLSDIHQDIESLSGGNQQKCILGRWLSINMDIFIFDEPTKGVDVGAKQEIYRIITELAKQGKVIIIISSDMPELISLSDRIGVMRHGEMVQILDKDEVTEHRLIQEYLGYQEKSEVI
jgi:ribose transport system ATP-binding protein